MIRHLYESPPSDPGLLRYKLQAKNPVIKPVPYFIQVKQQSLYIINIVSMNATSNILVNNSWPELVNRLPVAVFICNENGILTYYNQAAGNLWGCNPVVGKDTLYDLPGLYYPDGSPFPAGQFPVVLKSSNTKLVLKRTDGARRNIIFNSQPLYNQQGQLSGISSSLIDITAYRQQEQTTSTPSADTLQHEALIKSEQRFHNMIDEIQDYAIILLDNKGYIQNWNQGAEKIKGYKAEEVMGKNFSIFYTAGDRERQLPEQLIAEAVHKGRASYEGWRVKKDGSMFWGSMVITALHDIDNNITGFIKVTRDLTEKKLAEEQQLEHARLLEQKNRQLEQMNQELSSFVYIASHDLQEPLRKIETLSSYIIEYEKLQLSEKGAEFFRRLNSTAAQMKALIKDLLVYAQTTSIEQTEQTNKPAVSLYQLLQEAIESYREKLDETNAIIEADPLPEHPVVPFQFRQLFSNLLSNSLKYTQHGIAPHIIVRAEYITAAAIPHLAGSDIHKKYLHIIFKDNGIGFEPVYNEQVFKIFQRLHNKTRYSGTGIGLAICKRIVENHNGFITAEGMTNKGTTIHLYIPA